jgi:predicted transposase YdaD
MRKLLSTSDDRIQKAYEALKRHNWTNAELLAYDRVEDVLRDNRARENFVREEGREEGEMAKSRKIAEKLLLAGAMSLEEIADLTELTVEELRTMQ